jgi:DNA polymerase-3 subunit delta'
MAAPERLLDTIRSRTLPVRFAPLPDALLRELCAARGVTGEVAERAIETAAGSMSAALAAADPEQAELRARFVREARATIDAPDFGAAASFAEGIEKSRDRLLADLTALAGDFVREARSYAKEAPARALHAARCHALVLEAADAIARNGSVTATWLGMVAAMRRA